MPAISIASPFEYFTNASGLALESGYIYVGTAGLPAESNPIPTYTNVGLTTTIAQPIRTSAGYAVSSGTPITIYVDALDYSITIRDKNGTLVFSSLSAAGSIGVLPVAQGGTGASNQAGALLNLGALASSTVAKTANYTVVLTDRGESIFCNGTFTLSLTAAATLGDGFSFAVVNVGSGTITIDPNGSETIDGQATLALSQGQSCFVTTNGTEFRTLGLTGGSQLPAFNLLANNTGATAAPVAISKADLYPQSFQVNGTVAANALTATLQPTPITFRSATAGSGSVTNLMVSTALSLTVPSGATLGATNGVAATLALAAINNAGTVEYAINNVTSLGSLASEGIINTTALSASSNSANTWYSTTARTGVPYKLVGILTSTQATAGTYATAPSSIQGYGIAQQGMTVFGGGGVIYDRQVFTASGTWTKPSGANPNAMVLLEAWGGGGGGANANSGNIGGSGGSTQIGSQIIAWGGTGANGTTPGSGGNVGNGWTILEGLPSGGTRNGFFVGGAGASYSLGLPAGNSIYGGGGGGAFGVPNGGTGEFSGNGGAAGNAGVAPAGGGGGNAVNQGNSYGSGGGGGSYKYRFVQLSSLGATEVITIGAGGAANAPAGSGARGEARITVFG